MNDTAPDVAARFDALMAARSGSARVLMACEMFALARKLVVASIRAEDPTIDDARLRARVFERFYGEDFSDEERSRLLAAIR